MRIDEYPVQPSGQQFPILRWVLRVFPWVFVAIGIATLVVSVRTSSRALQSRHWPSTNGVIRSSVVVTEVQSPDRARGDEPTRSPRTVDHAAVVYDYEVSGKSYSGSTVSFGSFGSSNTSRASGVVTHYAEGKRVAVYYDPDRPEMSVLEPGFSWGLLIIPGIGLTFFIGGLVVAHLISQAKM